MSYPAAWADPIDHVRSLAEADTASATIEELKDLARPLVPGLNCKAAVIAAGTSLFRARIASCQPFQFINELGYPRNQVRLQRVNRPGSPMFYGCGAPFAPVYELDPSVGTLLVLSHWAARRPLRVIAIGFQDSVLGRPPLGRVHSSLSVDPPTPQVASWVFELGKVQHRPVPRGRGFVVRPRERDAPGGNQTRDRSGRSDLRREHPSCRQCAFSRWTA